MTKKADLVLVRCLLVSALIGSALVLFWLIFDTIRTYQQINADIEDYLQRSLFNGTDYSDVLTDDNLDQMLDQRLDSMKELLALLIHVVIILFGFVITFVENNSLVAIFGLILTSGLTANLFIPILFSKEIIVLAVILVTLSWLYFDLNSGAKDYKKVDRV